MISHRELEEAYQACVRGDGRPQIMRMSVENFRAWAKGLLGAEWPETPGVAFVWVGLVGSSIKYEMFDGSFEEIFKDDVGET